MPSSLSQRRRLHSQGKTSIYFFSKRSQLTHWLCSARPELGTGDAEIHLMNWRRGSQAKELKKMGQDHKCYNRACLRGAEAHSQYPWGRGEEDCFLFTKRFAYPDLGQASQLGPQPDLPLAGGWRARLPLLRTLRSHLPQWPQPPGSHGPCAL